MAATNRDIMLNILISLHKLYIEWVNIRRYVYKNILYKWNCIDKKLYNRFTSKFQLCDSELILHYQHQVIVTIVQLFSPSNRKPVG